ENDFFPFPAGPPVAAAVRSHFSDCPDSHHQFCFHGTCRFLVQEDSPACVCYSGFVGVRCEHPDLLAVISNNQNGPTITTLVVVLVVTSVFLILLCVLIHCCMKRKKCEWCRDTVCRHMQPGCLLSGGDSCCHSETGKKTL
uniref:Transforming growth factor alpha n=1 Tax=Latimeria chalumnae TaxID=7897 RepID=H3BEW0_LATCH